MTEDEIIKFMSERGFIFFKRTSIDSLLFKTNDPHRILNIVPDVFPDLDKLQKFIDHYQLELNKKEALIIPMTPSMTEEEIIKFITERGFILSKRESNKLVFAKAGESRRAMYITLPYPYGLDKLQIIVNHFLSQKIEQMEQALNQKSPVKGCCGEKKTLGVWNLAIAIASGKAPEQVVKERLLICSECQELDALKERLFRRIENKIYCGRPRLEHIYRDESIEGCGCNLEDKVKYNASVCPREKWLPITQK